MSKRKAGTTTSPAVYVLAVALLGGGGYYFYQKYRGYSPPPGGTYHGLLLVNATQGPITVSPTATLSFKVTGVTPGALIQIYLQTSPFPNQGSGGIFTQGAADSTGSVTLSYTLNGTQPVLMYALSYDTAIQSVAGYGNPVQINS